MSPSFSKEPLLHSLQSALEKESKAAAAWLGGSTATGTEDFLSDLDLVVVSEDPRQIFEVIESNLRSQFPLKAIWNVEGNPFPGLVQKFYILDQTPDTFFVDVGVFKSLNPDNYREYFNQARHGTPVVLFDKLKILEKASQNPKLENPHLDWNNLNARFEVIDRTFQKEALRGKYIDSFLFYHRLVGILVQALRFRYSPQRFDFGFRYLERDLPKQDAELIDELLRVTDLETMQFKAPLIKTRFLELQSQKDT